MTKNFMLETQRPSSNLKPKKQNLYQIDMGEAVSENRVARSARLVGIQAQIGHKKKPDVYGGKPFVVTGLVGVIFFIWILKQRN